jgi:hypothetical protein
MSKAKQWIGRLGLIAVVLVASAATHARADVAWKCTYKGNWTTTKTNNAGTMDLALGWELGDAGWKFSGEYSDKDGSAEVTGTCAGTVCSFAQSYKAGKLAGKSYYWTGLSDPNNANKSSKGTWGYKDKDRTSGGTWEATATCARASAGPGSAPAKPTPAGGGPAVKSNFIKDMFKSGKWGAYDTHAHYVVGGCLQGGAGMECSATVTSPKGKLVKRLTASVGDDMGEGTDRKQLDKLLVDLDKAIAGADGEALPAHPLEEAPFVQDDGAFKYTAKTNSLSISVRGKPGAKKIAGPKVPKGMKVDSATLYLFGAGSPVAAVLELAVSEKEGSGFDRVSVVFPIPEIGGGD